MKVVIDTASAIELLTEIRTTNEHYLNSGPTCADTAVSVVSAVAIDPVRYTEFLLEQNEKVERALDELRSPGEVVRAALKIA